jgi:hypothetical protein
MGSPVGAPGGSRHLTGAARAFLTGDRSGYFGGGRESSRPDAERSITPSARSTPGVRLGLPFGVLVAAAVMTWPFAFMAFVVVYNLAMPVPQ